MDEHIDTIRVALSRRVKSTISLSRTATCRSSLGQTNLICCFSSAPASTSNTPLQLSLLPLASGTPPINAINNHVMSRETSLMASAHGHLNNEVMNNNRPPAPKFRKWLMRNNKSSLSGLIHVGLQYKRDEGLALISRHASSPVYIHLPNIYRIVVCNNAEPRKKYYIVLC